jgi:serpin B
MSPSLRHLIAIPAILAVTCAHASCAPALHPATVRGGIEASSYSSFGIDLYKELLKEKPGVNIFISPASVGFALAMTYNGSVGETRTAMASTLGFPDNSFEAVNVNDSTLIRQMNDSIAGVKLSVANSLWARQGLAFMKSFLERNARYYGAEIETLDFSSPGSPAKINQWVARKTNDKITKIVDSIDGDAILFLINAIYFKGTWTKEFDKTLTQEEPFHLVNGATISRPLMSQSGTYAYFRGDGFQAARLPYGDGRIAMYVFLPDETSSLERFHERLSSNTWDTWMRSFASRRGRIVLPRFRLDYQSSLRQSLAALGMGIAFDEGRANFTGMFKAPGANAYVNDVVHKTFVDVNEEGTEAAAVTSVEMRATSAMEPERPFEMIVNRPFFFVIIDEKTGLLLFMGSIVNPE